jgi:hypothetical protein
MDGTGSGSYPMTEFCIGSVETSRSAALVLVGRYNDKQPCEDSSTAKFRMVHHHRLSRIRPLGRFHFRIYFCETYESNWTVGGTPWTGDQPDAGPLPTQDNTT